MDGAPAHSSESISLPTSHLAATIDIIVAATAVAAAVLAIAATIVAGMIVAAAADGIAGVVAAVAAGVVAVADTVDTVDNAVVTAVAPAFLAVPAA